MTDHTTQSIVVQAELPEVLAVIADVERYPAWADAVKSVEVCERSTSGKALRARYVLDSGVLKDTYELRYSWAADEKSVSWSLLESTIMLAQDGSYTLAEDPQGTKVTYELSVELRIPIIGLLRRKAERAIVDTALSELKKRVESLSPGARWVQ